MSITLNTVPKGPAIEPSGFCGPGPELHALSPLIRIHVGGVFRFDVICSCFGRDKPRASSLFCILSSINFYLLSVT
jgi:hypothetical protein